MISTNTISVQCYNADASVRLHCYDKGSPMTDVAWYGGSKLLYRGETLRLAIEDLTDDTLSCRDESSSTVATVSGESVRNTCAAGSPKPFTVVFYHLDLYSY